MKRLKISSGGQVSVPAAVRHRWKTRTLVADDRGDHLILRPAPDDPIEAARGALAKYFKPGELTKDWQKYREEELEIEERKFGRLGL